MAQQTKSHIIYIHRLSQAEKDKVYDLDKVWPDAELARWFRNDIGDVSVDRLILAQGFLDLAKLLVQPHPESAKSEVELRCCVNRSYYAIHHSVRAMCLYRDHWDPDGHAESINRLKIILGDPDFCRSSGLDVGVIKEIGEARDNRHVADYSPYDSSRESGGIAGIVITDSSWQRAAEFNIVVAERLMDAALKFIPV